MPRDIYQHQTPVWDAAKCAKAAKHTAKDGLVTPYPFKGYIGMHYGETRYNGGCTRDGEWYRGEYVPLPKVDPAFEIIRVVTWGYRIRRKVVKTGS